MIDLLLRGIDRLCRLSAYLAAALLLALSALGLTEIVLRSFFAYSLPFALEYGTYFLAVVMLAGSGWALREGGHIRVSIAFGPLSARGRRALDLFGSLLALVVAIYLARALINLALQSLHAGTVSFFPSQTPLAYPQIVFALGAVVLALALFARVVRLAIGEEPELAHAGRADDSL